MKGLAVFAFGVLFLSSLLGSPAHGQVGGMMGPGMPGIMGFAGHQMDHNLVIPQMAVGPDYVTTLVLLNLGSNQMMSWVPLQDLGTTGTVFFYKQDGSPLMLTANGTGPVSQVSFSLASSATMRFDLTLSGSDTSGWALISIDPPVGGISWGMMDGLAMTGGMRVMADVFYTYQNGSQTISRVGVTPSMYEMGQFANSMLPIRSSSSLSTGVAIVNIGAQTATIQLQLKDSSGQLFASKQVLLPPGNQMAQFVFQMFTGLPADFQGYLQIQTSNEGVVTMGMLMTGGIMTSVPMLHFGVVTMAP